jgi:hypothetical protein
MCDKAVTAPGHRFNELGRFRIVVESQPDLPDAEVQALLKINESVLSRSHVGAPAE